MTIKSLTDSHKSIHFSVQSQELQQTTLNNKKQNELKKQSK